MASTRESNTKPIFENGIWTGVVEPPFEEWRTCRKVLVDRLRMFPDRVGQIDALTGERDTYSAMTDRVIRCALWLRSQKLQTGDIVGICTYNHLDTFIPLVATFLCGFIANPWWDATLDNDLAKHFLNLSKPKIIFADEKTVHVIKKVVDESGADVIIITFKEVPGFQSLREIITKQKPDEVTKFECKDLDDLHEPVLILYTSGTTGYPKGALLPYGWLLSVFGSVSKVPAINFWTAGICWVTGAAFTFTNIMSCSTLVVYPNANEETICKIIDDYKVTQVMSINTANAIRLYGLKTIKNYDLSSPRVISVGGSSIPEEVDDFLQKTFKNAIVVHVYGSTEIGLMCTRTKWTGKLASCGQVVKNCQIKLIDPETGKLILEAHKEGEVCVKHPYTMLRYYNDPASTAAIFDEDGWVHTGDLAYYDDDGDFFIVDRQKELIKFRHGTHVSPSIIESVILKHPCVFEVGVVSKPHPTDIEQPVAFISKHPNTCVSEEEIAEIVTQNLPDHMQLRGGVIILDKLPHTESGKIAKKELRCMAKSLGKKCET